MVGDRVDSKRSIILSHNCELSSVKKFVRKLARIEVFQGCRLMDANVGIGNEHWIQMTFRLALNLFFLPKQNTTTVICSTYWRGAPHIYCTPTVLHTVRLPHLIFTVRLPYFILYAYHTLYLLYAYHTPLFLYAYRTSLFATTTVPHIYCTPTVPHYHCMPTVPHICYDYRRYLIFTVRLPYLIYTGLPMRNRPSLLRQRGQMPRMQRSMNTVHEYW